MAYQENLVRLARTVYEAALSLEERLNAIGQLGWEPNVITGSALAPLVPVRPTQMNAKYRIMKVLAALDPSVNWASRVDPVTLEALREPSGLAAVCSIGASIRQLLRAEARLAEVEEITTPGTPSGDLLAILATQREGAIRMAAAERLCRNLGHVIYPKRWESVLPELRNRAREHSLSLPAELQWQIVAGIFAVVAALGLGSDLGKATIGDLDGVLVELRARLNRHLTEDLAGPEWSRDPKRGQLGEHAVQTSNEMADLDARLSVDLILARAKLSPTEMELVAAARALGSIEAAAEALKIAPGTARQRWARARKKMSAVEAA